MSKGLDTLEKLYPKTTYMPYYTRSEKRAFCKIIEKELKALEIIKNKVGIHWEEILSIWLRNKLITQEEYDLLKEVLL